MHWSDEEKRVLEVRARSLARSSRGPGRTAIVEGLEIEASGERYVLDSSAVLSVAALSRLTPLPRAPGHVAGLLLQGGEVLPTFFLGAVFDLPLSSLPEHGRAVLCGEVAPELALVVDRVLTIRRFEVDSLRPVSESMSPDARALVRGLCPDGVPFVDGAALLASDRLHVDIPREERA